ncbi:MAG: single-stranded-DNA-specific exonuclease RecJ [bacterium]
MNKHWQICPQISQGGIDKHLDFDPVVLQLLHNRGLHGKEIDNFFNDDLLHDPFLFKNMESACKLVIKHIKQGDKIAIVGDYDADGVTAAVVLKEVLDILHAKTEIYIPSRLKDGYGLNQRIIDKVIEADCKLLITVDNGIRSKQEVSYAKSKGLSVIVTDHHVMPSADDLPDCLIIDPISDNYPFKYLAGVGVSFKLSVALISLSNIDNQTKEKIINKVLDLVAIGTIADCVSLLNENRNLVKLGLRLINIKPRLGIKELARAANVDFPLNEWNIGWQIVPRLNVAGRLDHANTSYKLLLTEDREEAIALANHLNEQNIVRQSITKKITEYCEKLIYSKMKDDKILVLLSPDIEKQGAESWAEGVIGLVAGRLVEKYGKPALVICSSQGQLKGSARSIDEFNIVQALDEVNEHLVRYGGHKMAAGFTVKPEKLKDFVLAIKMIAEQKIDKELIPKIMIEAELTLEQINANLLDQLEKFAPFGQENPEPIFVSYNVKIDNCIAMGLSNQHLKMHFGQLEAVAFSIKPEWSKLKIGDNINIAYTLSWNEFNGRKKIQLKIIDLQL